MLLHLHLRLLVLHVLHVMTRGDLAAPMLVLQLGALLCCKAAAAAVAAAACQHQTQAGCDRLHWLAVTWPQRLHVQQSQL